MKKFIIYIFASFFTLMYFSACKKFLTPEPAQLLLNDSAIKSVKDLQSVLYGAYDGLQNGNVLGGNMTGYADLISDDFDVREGVTLNNFGNFEIYNGLTSSQIGALRGMWADCYSTINRVNYVLDAIENNSLVKNDPNYNSQKDLIKGQALFIRGIVLFELMKFWSLPYNIQNPSENTKEQSGVVIRTKPYKVLNQAEDKVKRATIEECFSQVISDLLEANKSLDSKLSSSKELISADAANAILARVYFNKGDYSNASLFANKIVSSNRYNLSDSLPLFYKLSGSASIKDMDGGSKPETIFQLINTLSDNSSSFPGFYTQTSSGLLSFLANTYNLFDPTDKRTRLINVTFKRTSKYNFVFASGNSGPTVSPNLCIIRFAEIHLIRAESNLLSGASSQEALDSYNLIRKRAYKTNYIEETSIDGLLEKVRLERRLEMVAEQSDRYMNLRRLRLPLRKANENEYSKFLFKIPQEEISANPDLLQN